MVAFHTVTSLMGEPAAWETIPAEVLGVGLYKEPTKQEQLTAAAMRSQGAEYNSVAPEFRYVIGQFPGLYESVRAGNTEVLRLSDGRRFLIGDFDKKYDGETFVALLSPISR